MCEVEDGFEGEEGGDVVDAEWDGGDAGDGEDPAEDLGRRE